MANYHIIYTAISNEFDPEIALVVTQILTLNYANLPTDEDYNNPHSYTDRIIEISRDTLWEYERSNPERFELAIKLWRCIYDWEICDDKSKTFTELLKELDEKDNPQSENMTSHEQKLEAVIDDTVDTCMNDVGYLRSVVRSYFSIMSEQDIARLYEDCCNEDWLSDN